ncbi:hypothetical protein [Kribbella sp. DT2]|uniref:hypothetical protein n=1 Tax=Kribbella sp. DT2 TaxID=3393427 RepID=UPI003CF03136
MPFAALIVAVPLLVAVTPVAGQTAQSFQCSGSQVAKTRVLQDLSRMTQAERTLTPTRKVLSSHFVVPSTVGLAQERFTSRLEIVVRRRQPLSQGPQESSARIRLAINDRVSNLIELTGDRDRIAYTFVGLLTGAQRGMSKSVVTRLGFENYGQLGAVKAGRNVLSVVLDDAGVVDSAVVSERSSVAYTTAAPQQLTLTTPETMRVPAGTEFTIPFQLARRCERPDKPVTVAAGAMNKSPSSLTIVADAKFSGIGDGIQGVLRARSDQPGTYYIQVTMQGGYNDQTRLIAVQVDQPNLESGAETRVTLAVLFLALAGILFVLRIRRWSPSASR